MTWQVSTCTMISNLLLQTSSLLFPLNMSLLKYYEIKCRQNSIRMIVSYAKTGVGHNDCHDKFTNSTSWTRCKATLIYSLVLFWFKMCFVCLTDPEYLGNNNPTDANFCAKHFSFILIHQIFLVMRYWSNYIT